MTLVIIVTLRDQSLNQILLLLVLTLLFQVLIIGGKPMMEPVENKVCLFNEIMISVYLYILIGLSEVTD